MEEKVECVTLWESQYLVRWPDVTPWPRGSGLLFTTREQAIAHSLDGCEPHPHQAVRIDDKYYTLKPAFPRPE